MGFLGTLTRAVSEDDGAEDRLGRQETVNCRCLLKVPNPVGLDLSAASTQVTTFFFLPVTGEKRSGPVARVV